MKYKISATHLTRKNHRIEIIVFFFKLINLLIKRSDSLYKFIDNTGILSPLSHTFL